MGIEFGPVLGDIHLGNFLLGVISSLFASVVILALTQFDDLVYLFTASRRYKHLEGAWFQYHLTNDSKRQPSTFWSTHREVIHITSFGRVRGESKGRHQYRIRGAIRQNVMRLRLTNQDAAELSASFTYPRLLARDTLVGVWIGHDYDEAICAGPVVLSRTSHNAVELAKLTRNERLLSVGRRKAHPPIDELLQPAPEAAPDKTPVR